MPHVDAEFSAADRGPAHRWLDLVDADTPADLERSLVRLARLAAAAHRAEAATTAPPHRLTTPDRARTTLYREDRSRGHGWSSSAVGLRPRGGSEAKECDR